MLEPAVRPAGTPAPGVKAALPVEQQSFEQLLQEHEQSQASALPVAGFSPGASLMRSLNSLGNVENASLRQMLAGTKE